MATEFTTWAALRIAIKNAIANAVADAPMAGSYSIGGRSLTYRSFDELVDLYKKTYILESLESTDEQESVAYGEWGGF